MFGRKKPKQNANRLEMKNKISRALDLPSTSFLNIAQIEMMGNNEAVIEGCKGIIEYTSECIRLSAGSLIVCFRGMGLQMKCMTETAAIIQGEIASLDFVK